MATYYKGCLYILQTFDYLYKYFIFFNYIKYLYNLFIIDFAFSYIINCIIIYNRTIYNRTIYKQYKNFYLINNQQN